jgi:hypothetical protein
MSDLLELPALPVGAVSLTPAERKALVLSANDLVGARGARG